MNRILDNNLSKLPANKSWRQEDVFAKLKYIYEYQIIVPSSSGKERVHKLKLHDKEVSRSNRLEGHAVMSRSFNLTIVSC